MPTHVALLRGINVGGRSRVAMADLREVVTGLGHRDVATYIQSGNVVFTAGTSGADPADTSTLAAELGSALAAQLDVRPAVVVLTRQELEQVLTENPFADEVNPKHVHAVFRAEPYEPEEAAALLAALEQSRARGSAEDARIVGRTVYLHTPDGLSNSELASRLGRPSAATTARNWATATRLVEMLRGS